MWRKIIAIKYCWRLVDGASRRERYLWHQTGRWMLEIGGSRLTGENGNVISSWHLID